MHPPLPRRLRKNLFRLSLVVTGIAPILLVTLQCPRNLREKIASFNTSSRRVRIREYAANEAARASPLPKSSVPEDTFKLLKGDYTLENISLPRSNKKIAYLNSSMGRVCLGTLGGKASFAAAVSHAGAVVGYSETSRGDTHAFLWERGKMHDLGTLGGVFSSAMDVNLRGEVVGYSLVNGDYHAFYWHEGKMEDIGTLGGSTSKAQAINNNGDIVGYSDSMAGNQTAFIYRNGMMQALGSLGGTHCEALHINDRGQVVGWSETSQYTEEHACLWENNSITDLHQAVPASYHWKLQKATYIDEEGRMFGVGERGGSPTLYLMEFTE